MKSLPILAATLVLAAPALAQDDPRTQGEIELAERLGDRVAGAAVDCLPRRGLRNMTIIDGTALVFDYGGTLYVNVPARPELLRERDRLITPQSFGRLCSFDYVRTEHRFNGFTTGNIDLGEFVPFRRVKAES